MLIFLLEETEKAVVTATHSSDATAADLRRSEFANFSWGSERFAAQSRNKLLVRERRGLTFLLDVKLSSQTRQSSIYADSGSQASM